MTLLRQEASQGTALEFHPLANLFPLIESTIGEIAADIFENGFRVGEEIVLLDGKILDGRARYSAFLSLVESGHIEPSDVDPETSWHFVKFGVDGIDGVFSAEDIERGPLAYVISKNLHRRHLTDDQRRMVAARIANLGRGRPDENAANGGINRKQAASMLAVDEAGVERARGVVTKGAEELQAAVDHGEISVRAAADIARLPKNEQKALLIEVAKSPDGKRALKQAAKEVRANDQKTGHIVRQELAERLNARNPALPAGRTFNLVLIDIPRKHNVYADQSGSEKAPDNHYATMGFEETLAFPIDTFAAKDAIILFWSTAASLIDDIDILAEWGFVALRPRDGLGKLVRPNSEPLPPLTKRGAYGSHQIWRKVRPGDQMGMGRWFRDQHELLIVARRGNIPAPLPGTQAESVFDAPAGEHSAKPNDDTFAWIDRCWPHLSKVYIFARGEAPPGWTFWGNEASPSGLRPTSEAQPTIDGEAYDPETGEIQESRAKTEEAVRPDTAQAQGMLPRGEEGSDSDLADDAASRLAAGRTAAAPEDEGGEGRALANPSPPAIDFEIPAFLRRVPEAA